MSIRDWPAAERPREKLLEQGAATLSDAELLAIFLRTGVAGQSAVDLARHLLSDFGSLRALLEADLDSFSQRLFPVERSRPPSSPSCDPDAERYIQQAVAPRQDR